MLQQFSLMTKYNIIALLAYYWIGIVITLLFLRRIKHWPDDSNDALSIFLMVFFWPSLIVVKILAILVEIVRICDQKFSSVVRIISNRRS